MGWVCDGALVARGGSTSSVVALTQGELTPPVFWLPNATSAQEAVPLARALTGRSTYVPFAKGFGRPGPVAVDAAPVVGDAIEALEADGPDGPIIVAAFSNPCHHAQRMAAELTERGRDVPLLGLPAITSPSPPRATWSPASSSTRWPLADMPRSSG